MNHDKIPRELRAIHQWIVWRIEPRSEGEEPTKIPYSPQSEHRAKASTPSTWASFEQAQSRFNRGGFIGVGFEFHDTDPFCGIDLDGCRNPETGAIEEWAREHIKAFDSYTEVSPSQTGVKIFCKAVNPLGSGKNRKLPDLPRPAEKLPGVEVYDRGRYFAVTGLRLAGVSPNVEARQSVLDAFCLRYWPPELPPRPLSPIGGCDVTERARKYLATVPPAVSGQGGHNQTFHAACVLVLGFGLSQDQAYSLMCEWNTACNPPWTDRDLRRKVAEADKQPGERNYLRDAQPDTWDRIPVPNYSRQPDKSPEVALPKATTLATATAAYLDSIKGGATLVELGLPDLDCAVGGGVEWGEMVIVAARPSHGKSAFALQAIHHATASGFPSIIVSEEMSALSLGKRVIQFATDVPSEWWAHNRPDVDRQLARHFDSRKPCFVVENCRTAERAAEAIRQHVAKEGVRFAVVDYAQLLGSAGKGRYEQITNTSVVLRQLANETTVVLLVLCQLNRAIESRGTFSPQMSDIKDTGQLEQDADVILFLCWPHRLDPKEDPRKFMVFVSKNRNRPINAGIVECTFQPSRQTIRDARPSESRDDFPAQAAGVPFTGEEPF